MIKVLDSFIADKIAAGEVIERPLSIIKELVENSIDAGADKIVIEIRNGGKSYIRVTDNGCGIQADEVEIAFLRHATGKISSIDDLNHIVSLGFRGEALASISAISRLSIITRTADEKAATRLVMHGGQVISKDLIGANIGTTIVVEDVFYNTPARRKFMGSDAREASAIIELLQKLAIYYSGIKFMVYNGPKLVINTAGDNNYLSTIRAVYPSNDFSELIKVENSVVKGYISDPGTTKTSRKGQIFFVNGRIVDSKDIQAGLEKGYGDRVFAGFPIAIIFVTVEADAIDVNIHPGKMEVKFLHSDEIINGIAAAVHSVMDREGAIPHAFNQSEHTASNIIDTPFERAEIAESLTINEKLKDDNRIGIRDFLSNLGEKELEYSGNKLDVPTDTIAKDKLDDMPITKLQEEINVPFDFDDIYVKGYVFNSFIITESKDNLFILDQHAAHERIFYERLMEMYDNSEKHSQPILTPILVEASMDVYNMDRTWMQVLNQMGYQIEDFGEGSFIIKEIPSDMDLGEADRLVKNYLDELGYIKTTECNRAVIDKIIMRSCKSAVKANDVLSNEEISELIAELANCKNPYSCPHGRPTFIKVRRYELERAFRRK